MSLRSFGSCFTSVPNLAAWRVLDASHFSPLAHLSLLPPSHAALSHKAPPQEAPLGTLKMLTRGINYLCSSAHSKIKVSGGAGRLQNSAGICREKCRPARKGGGGESPSCRLLDIEQTAQTKVKHVQKRCKRSCLCLARPRRALERFFSSRRTRTKPPGSNNLP